jgi:hypothetical protein
MELLTEDLRQRLPALYSQEGVQDPIAEAKLFSPDSNWTWFITEGQAEGEDFVFFGYFNLSELHACRGPLGLPSRTRLAFHPAPVQRGHRRLPSAARSLASSAPVSNPGLFLGVRM